MVSGVEGTRIRVETMKLKNLILSGIQPTGEPHIGNYFGAIAHWVRLQEQFPCLFMVADLHAMTLSYDPTLLRRRTEQMAIDLMACGIDPSKSLLIVQSLVPEHAELAWILSCLCPFGDLTRQTQFRDQTEGPQGAQPDSFVSAGLFTYPVLQAADILLYRATLVPVGRDQVQHLELARELSRRFNRRFGPLFPEPQPHLSDRPKILSLADPSRKMSKRHGPGQYLGLFDSDAEVQAKVRRAVTDSGASGGEIMSAGVANLFALLEACAEKEEAAALRGAYEAGERRYSRLKDAVAQALIGVIAPLRRRRAELMDEREEVLRRVREMSERARALARDTMREVRARTGLPPF